MTQLTTDAAARKAAPVVRGFLDYFPAATMEVAALSKTANEQHNPGEAMHWARDKSNDHADCLVRHLMERGTIDTDGVRHSAKVAWRAFALLEEELEAAGAAPGRASVFAEDLYKRPNDTTRELYGDVREEDKSAAQQLDKPKQRRFQEGDYVRWTTNWAPTRTGYLVHMDSKANGLGYDWTLVYARGKTVAVYESELSFA